MTSVFFKDRDGQTPLPPDLQKGLIPKNIQTIGELDQYEERNIAEGLAWLEKQTDAGTSYAFWLKLHKRLLGEVWNWAGTVRKHELDNLDFHKPHQIWEGLRDLEKTLTFWLKNKSFSEEEVAARFHERIETIHPFPNGNGRFGRILVEYFCSKNGSTIPTWGSKLGGKPKERRKAYIAAIESARRNHDYKPLIEFMFS